MTQPVILAVDDEPIVLSAVGRDLREGFGDRFRIVTAPGGAEALEAVRSFKARDTPIALFVVDQRMPTMTGLEFLSQALTLYPDAKKVLLTAYADTRVAIEAINGLGLDQYLMKPWDQPEETLFPVLDELLDEWSATAVVPYEGIREVSPNPVDGVGWLGGVP